MSENIEKIMNVVSDVDARFEVTKFAETVYNYFVGNPRLSEGDLPVVHSVKYRIKNLEHLKKKIERKISIGVIITPSNVFEKITDMAGVRVLHLHQKQLQHIDREIRRKVGANDWVLAEPPKAYTWDPEAEEYMRSLNLDVSRKDSFYTSVHYLLRPRSDSFICCEVQVRTLFEEIWGEVDHAMNYPDPSSSVACKEQLRVLSKIVGAGSRLVDAAFRVHEMERSEV